MLRLGTDWAETGWNLCLGSPILGAAMEFTIGAALTRWLGDQLLVDRVNVTVEDETIIAELAYINRKDLSRQAVRIHFR